MSRNVVQFQKGLSMAEFQQQHGTEDKCHEALVKMRWPDGFVCPRCSGCKYSFSRERKIFQCSGCRKQTSVKAGTLFHKSLVPLTKWFLAMYHISGSKNDVAALELMRHLSVKWDTAWLLKQKLMEAMRQRNLVYKLAGDVQMDDAYLGGEKPGKPGRGAEGKAPFVAAVATREGRPQYLHVRRISAFTSAAIKAYAEANIEKTAHVLTDGLSCFNGIAEAGIRHTKIVTGGGRPKGSQFKWINTGISNLKGTMLGTCRSISFHHADRYLGAYEWRYNRRFDLAENLGRLCRAAVRTEPQPHRALADVRRPAAEMAG